MRGRLGAIFSRSACRRIERPWRRVAHCCQGFVGEREFPSKWGGSLSDVTGPARGDDEAQRPGNLASASMCTPVVNRRSAPAPDPWPPSRSPAAGWHNSGIDHQVLIVAIGGQRANTRSHTPP